MNIRHLKQPMILVKNSMLWVLISLLSVAIGVSISFDIVLGLVMLAAPIGLSLSILLPHMNITHLLLWIILWGLILFSHGFINVPMPFTSIPFVEVLAFYIIVRLFPKWRHFLTISVLKRAFWLLIAVDVVVFARLVFDLPHYGLLALRDSTFAFELWFLFPAVAIGYKLGIENLRKKLRYLFAGIIIYLLSFPFREVIYKFSPVVGIRAPLPLFQYQGGYIVASGLFYFVFIERNPVIAIVMTVLTLLDILIIQSRGVYLAVLFSSVLILVLYGKTLFTRLRRLVFLVPVVLFALVVSYPFLSSLPGRLTQVSFETLINQLGTLIGREGPGSGSLYHRLFVWHQILMDSLSTPARVLFGSGLGPDLFGGFTTERGIIVRKPHNDFLEVFARLGAVGFVSWVLFILNLVVCSINLSRTKIEYAWILALQVVVLITSLSQPAMSFAYVTMVWTGLTGLWLGARVRERGVGTQLTRSKPLHSTRW